MDDNSATCFRANILNQCGMIMVMMGKQDVLDGINTNAHQAKPFLKLLILPDPSCIDQQETIIAFEQIIVGTGERNDMERVHSILSYNDYVQR
jgi:hypothetical protein